jgi:metal-sulfur cluster biosynthetic enzyme/ribosomal protein L22
MTLTAQWQIEEPQLRITQTDGQAALRAITGLPVIPARARLRFGPGRTCEQLARLLDRAIVQAEAAGLRPELLVVADGTIQPAEDIIRVRRKAHGVADWIHSPTCRVRITLHPAGLHATSTLPTPPAAATPSATTPSATTPSAATSPAPATSPAATSPAATSPAATTPPAAATASPAAVSPAAVSPAVTVPPAATAAPAPAFSVAADEPPTAAVRAVRDALSEVIDPDLGVNVVDLGFVRAVSIQERTAVITMTLTSAACPLTGVLESQIRTELAPLEDIDEFRLDWQWVPAWRPADMTDSGREQLLAVGFTI